MNESPGCLMVPLLIVVVPVRLLWELLAATGRFINRYVMRPIGWLLYNGLVRPVQWLLYVMVVVPVRWLMWATYHYVFRPLGIAIGLFLYHVLVRPLRWLFETVVVPLLLKPLGIVIAWIGAAVVYVARWIGRGLAVLWRFVLPALLALGRTIRYAWHLAGVVLYHVLVQPVRWLWRYGVRPVLVAVRWAWRAAVVPPARWFRKRVWARVRAAVRSIEWYLGLDQRSG